MGQIKNMIKTAMLKLPFKNIIVFESIPDFSDNTYWLFKYMIEETDFLEKYECVWFLNDYSKKRDSLCGKKIVCVDNRSNSIKSRCQRFYYLCFAKCIIDCNNPIWKKRDGQYRVYLTHGMPLKIPVGYLESIGKVDLLPVSGSNYIDFFKKYTFNENVKFLGSPRNDVFLKEKNKKIEEKYIVWMPTYRQHKSSPTAVMDNLFPLGVPVLKSEEDIELLDKALGENNVTLMFRPHPAQDLSVLKLKGREHIVIANDDYLKSIGMELYPFIAKSSGLITDYSSIYLDYLLLDRPVGLTFEDAEQFSKQWPFFYKDLKKDMPGVNIIDINDLISFIMDIRDGRDIYSKERNDFMRTWGIEEIESCKSIAQEIISHLEKGGK